MGRHAVRSNKGDDVINHETVHESDTGASELILRSRRLDQLAQLVLLGLSAAAATMVLHRNWITLQFLLGALGLVGLCYWLNQRGRTAEAGVGILWALTLMATAAMWFNQGLYSPALLVYPCVLVIANMLARLRHFLMLLGFMLLALAAITHASVAGLHVFVIKPFQWQQLAYAAVILSVFAVMISMLAGDLRQALKRLRAEVEQVQQARDRISYQAEHDALTGLPNRVASQRLAMRAMAHASRQGKQVGFVLVDVDNFKQVNESLGHKAGDDLLQQVATRLRSTMRSYDIVTRYGGDEFLLVVPDVAGANEVAAVATHVLGGMVHPFTVSGLALGTSCSIGIALYPDDGQDFESLLQKADIAVRHAGDAGRNAFRFFDERMNANMLEDLNISTSLRGAVERQEFKLHYQPIYELATGRLVGAEALLRWQHPERGMIPPGRFIPVAERSGQIIELGQWVLDEACRQLQAWQGTAFAELVMSVNVSTVQFKRGTLESVVIAALERHGVVPGRLELEVTESALIQDPETLVETLGRLKRLGVRLAIDDFGTGYSNLSYLQRFEIDKLKIDQSFVRRLTERDQDRAIVRAIIQMAKSLGLTTTGEGIEDEETRQHLLALGCEQGQGFGLGRPQALEQFEQFCSKRLLRHP